MIECMLREVTSTEGVVGRGRRKFQVVPSRGDVILRTDRDGEVQVYEVLGVAHPEEPASTVGDLFIRHVGSEDDWLADLAGRSSEGAAGQL